MNTIDLHVHSNCSDGTLSPTELVQLAKQTGLTAFALTDHDNTNGLAEALLAADQLSLEVIPGIEFSTRFMERDIHIVGLEPDWQSQDFQEQLQLYRQGRNQRNQEVIQKMRSDGIDISCKKMHALYGKDTILTRAHFARYLTEHGHVATISDAFQLYLNEGGRYFVPREKITPFEVTKLIRSYHGIPILAHPFQYHFSDQELRELLRQLCQCGLIGIEVYYSTHTKEQTEYLQKLAQEFDLLPSGGSDFHGLNKPDISLGIGKGNLSIPYELLNQLRQKKGVTI